MTTPPQPPAAPKPAQPEAAAKPAEAATNAQPEAVRTIADEQRERSEDLQAKGVEAVKAAQDQRGPERSTPPARAAQTKAAP
jgi:hypothetical protein